MIRSFEAKRVKCLLVKYTLGASELQLLFQCALLHLGDLLLSPSAVHPRVDIEDGGKRASERWAAYNVPKEEQGADTKSRTLFDSLL